MKRFSARYKVTYSRDVWISIRIISSENFEKAVSKALALRKRDFSSDFKVELISLEEDD